MPATERNIKVDIKRQTRVDDERHGWTHEHSVIESGVWMVISPTLGGGRRERQVFGPRIEFEMNAMGIAQFGTDIRVTDLIEVRHTNEEYEALAIVDSMYKGKKKFVALKSKPDVPG